MDKIFISPEYLLVLVCPVRDADITRRALANETWFYPDGGMLKMHLYYVGPKERSPNRTTPLCIRTLLFPPLSPTTRVDLESPSLMPQASDITSIPVSSESRRDSSLPFQAKNDSGLICASISGQIISDDEDASDLDVGAEWILDIVMCKSNLLNLARHTTNFGKVVPFSEWGGKNIRIFPHSEKDWNGTPKIYSSSSYRVVSIVPLGPDPSIPDAVIPEIVIDGRLDQGAKRPLLPPDRRLDILDFCPGRIEDIREALESERKIRSTEEDIQLDVKQSISSPTAQQVALPGSSSRAFGRLFAVDDRTADTFCNKWQATLMESPTIVEPGIFLTRVETSLPFVLSQFDLGRGRRDDGELPLPEAVFVSETDIVVQVSSPSFRHRRCVLRPLRSYRPRMGTSLRAHAMIVIRSSNHLSSLHCRASRIDCIFLPIFANAVFCHEARY